MDIALPSSVRAAYGADNERIRPFYGGLVNYSFAVGEPTRLVIQGINDRYLPEPHLVMENLVRIVGHLEWRHAAHRSSAPRWYPTVEMTETGRPYTVDEQGRIWRALRYIDASPVQGDVPWSTLAGAAALFGRFIAALDDFGDPPLGVVTPEFRSTARILADFDEVIQRAAVIPEKVLQLRERALRLTDRLVDVDQDLGGDTALPCRVVHNDTKLANCLVNDEGVAVAVIDLDLAMNGHVMDDFGDLVRSACQHRDGADPLVVAEAVATPFIGGTAGTLDPAELHSLAFGPLRVCVQLAWRYLSDALRPEPLLRVGGAAAALAKANTNLDIAERLAGNQPQLGAVIQHAVGSA